MNYEIEAITVVSVRYPKPVHAIMRCHDTVLFAPYSFTPTSQSRPEQKNKALGKEIGYCLFLSRKYRAPHAKVLAGKKSSRVKCRAAKFTVLMRKTATGAWYG